MQFILGVCIAAMLLLITAIILCDSDLVQEMDFDERAVAQVSERY